MATPLLPGPLRIGRVIASVAALGGLLGLALAVFDLHVFGIGDQVIGGHEFLRRLGIPYAFAVATMAAAALGLWQERLWARPAILIVWLGFAILAAGDALAAGFGRPIAAIRVAGCLLFLAAAAWYLYRKPDPVAYFNALASRTRAGRHGAV